MPTETNGVNKQQQTNVPLAYSLWVGPGGMLHAVVSSMHAHVLKGRSVIVRLARNAHHSGLGDWLREHGSLSWIWRHILSGPKKR